MSIHGPGLLAYANISSVTTADVALKYLQEDAKEDRKYNKRLHIAIHNVENKALDRKHAMLQDLIEGVNPNTEDGHLSKVIKNQRSEDRSFRIQTTSAILAKVVFAAAAGAAMPALIGHASLAAGAAIEATVSIVAMVSGVATGWVVGRAANAAYDKLGKSSAEDINKANQLQIDSFKDEIKKEMRSVIESLQGKPEFDLTQLKDELLKKVTNPKSKKGMEIHFDDTLGNVQNYLKSDAPQEEKAKINLELLQGLMVVAGANKGMVMQAKDVGSLLKGSAICFAASDAIKLGSKSDIDIKTLPTKVIPDIHRRNSFSH